jgi:hypothetical protein
MEYSEKDVLDVIQRWEPTGLLYGLPYHEKEELSLIYDNVTRFYLGKNYNKDISDIFDIVLYPICRRLYRRIGVNFNSENLINTLYEKIKNGEYEKIINNTELKGVAEFCIHFSDNYEDEESLKKFLSDEEYGVRIVKTLDILKGILLNDKVVSYVDRKDENWVTVTSNDVRSKKETRFLNQKTCLEVLNSILKDTNKGI